jgi:serine/threonine protein kinase/Tfp pilus assembly protein PilF
VGGGLALPERLAAGTLFADRYRLVHRLGRGGLGEVYRAEDLRLEQTVALKFLFPSIQENARALERFREEARLARRIAHGSVCRIFDFGITEGLAYVAMEFIEGDDLARVRKRLGRLSPERARKIAMELCAGLGAIHEEGILHRDLKPANVMLDGQGRVRIVDFGLAVRTEVLSGPEAASGTPAYRAPEQAEGREATARSDLYSLGLILWELWTGEFLRVLDRRDPPPLSSRVQGVDPALDRIVARCLDLDPRRRPASAEAVATALRETFAPSQGPTPRALLVSGASSDAVSPVFVPDLLESFGGQRAWDGEGDVWLFERAWDAVSFAVALREELEEADSLRIVVDIQELDLSPRRPGAEGPGAHVGDVAATARALVARAHGGQTLLTSPACHLARRGGRAVEGGEALVWHSHGSYALPGGPEPIEVFEVRRQGRAPLAAPRGGGREASLLPGWRPAPGVAMPHRPHYRIERRLGEGGFGEAWLVRHQTTGERRVFKFCFEALRLRSLRREITLFRLLKEELGDREDIARVLDWNLEEAPYFIESEYTSGGNLEEWAEEQGGIERVPLEQRLELIAQVADALAAAHSVGVLHKDVKPANILITPTADGGFKARLADFGVGLATDRKRLEAAGITVAGLTTLEPGKTSDSGSGTRLYMAPEVLEGRAPTLQADVYSLGVVLYQVVVGRLGRAVASGWREGIADDLLVEDVAAAIHGNPESRLADARDLALRLRSLEERRAVALEAARREEEQRKLRQQVEQAVQRRRASRLGFLVGLVVMAILAGLAWWALFEREREAEAREQAEAGRQREALARREAEASTEFLVGLFDVADPFSTEQADAGVPDLSAVELLERGIGRIETDFAGRPLVQARLLHKLGTVFQGLGQRERAKELLERSLAIRTELLGPEDLEVAQGLVALGSLESPGAPLESEALLRKALEIRHRHLGEDHLDVAESKYELAANLALQGAYQEAETLHRDSLELRRRYLGEDHTDVAESLHDLAMVLEDQGSYPEAEGLYRESLATYRRLLGADHPRVALSLNNLAAVLWSQGAYPEAESLYRESLTMCRRRLGEDHPLVATSLNNLAAVLKAQGSYTEAESLYREALALNRRLLGPEHPHLAMTLNNLAGVLAARGAYGEAENVYRESLSMYRRLVGPENPNVAVSLNNLAQVLIERGEFQEAESLIQEALRLLRQVYAPDHWRISYAEGVEAALWSSQGRFREAEAALLTSHAHVSESRGENSPYVQKILQYLVTLYETWNKPGEAARYRALWIEAGGQPEG